jgi:hypothetical protein
VDPFPPILAFWQFGSLGMLAWGLAAALPILIHLWSRRRYREERWAAMEFLLAAMRKNARRIQVEQWLLLAVRTAILLLFALALADPQLSLLSGWTGVGQAGQTHVVLVIDGSYSMDYRRDNKSRFDAARDLARQFVADGRQGDGYTLVVMGQPPQVVIQKPAFDPSDVSAEIGGLTLRHSGASLAATLAEVESILRQSSTSDPRLVQRRVLFFTDLQQQTWAEVNTADCRERLARLEKLATLAVVDLGEASSANLAVARLTTSQPLATTRAEVTLSAEIQSFARQDWPRQAVEILVDGVRIADERIDLPAGGQATVSTPYRFATPGEHVVEVRLADDALPLDNRRWLSVPVREAIRVLLVGGRPGETRHLALALNPRPNQPGPIEVREVPESALAESDLTEIDCVMISNVGRFSREEAAVLRAHLERGGGLVVFLGDSVQAENYNELLAVDNLAERVLPARLADLVRLDGEARPTDAEPASSSTSPPQFRINPLEYKHPIVAPFRGHEESGLLTIPIWRYVRLSPLPGAQVALAFDRGDPLLVEETLGRGRSILLATAAAPDSVDASTTPPTPWTALSSWPSFPPLVHEILRSAVEGRNEDRNRLVGQSLGGAVAGADRGAPLNLTRPDGSTEQLPLAADGLEAVWTDPRALTSGVYTAQFAGGTTEQFAVNLDTRESDLARFDPELLPSQFSRQWQSPASAPLAALPSPSGTSYFRGLLAAVLVLLLVDPALAWYLGRGRG